MRNTGKKGISIMIGYVLLVTFAVVMGSIVYIWMKSYVPVNAIECSDGVSVMISDSNCDDGNLTIQVKNNGLFNIDGLFIKVSFKPEEEIATNSLLVGQPGGFIKPRGSGLFVDEARNKDTIVFKYDSRVCAGKGQCSTKEVCSGGNICSQLVQADCSSVSGCSYDEVTGLCSGVPRCEDITIGADCLPAGICSWINVNYYNVSAIEIIPAVYMEYKNKNRFVTCGNAKIREELQKCSVYAEV